MGNAADGSAQVARAKRHFVEQGHLLATEVAPHIARSWSRSHQHGAGLRSAEPVSRAELADRRDAAALLWRCAQPELDALAEHVVPQGCVVILSDATGMILDEAGSAEFLAKAERVALLPGVDWSEAQRGTNAIGTALEERNAVLVLGPEHFLEQNAALGCAAAPILTARGELAGVLDVSGEALRVDAHALALVRMAAAQVEHRMMTRFTDGELVHFHVRPGLVGTPREGLLAIAGGRIVGLNRVAANLLGGWSDWLDRPAEVALGERWQRLVGNPGLVTAPDRRQWAVAIDVPRSRTSVRQSSQGNVALPLSLTPAGGGPGAARPWGRSERRPAPLAVAHERAPQAEDPIVRLLSRATRVLDAGLAVLLTGETGSGKDWFARRLHAQSQRAAGPLTIVNCAALPESLIEAELFGYEDGAFTGARRGGQPGRLREANGGILFLDEIGDMPLALQPRLLRVLEDHSVRPLGSARDVPVDFRIVCATHQDLQALVRDGRFREDLYYRLNGCLVQLPPLRSRPDRRQLIIQVFNQVGAAAKQLHLGEEALAWLEQHPWRGNIRELVSVLASTVALCDAGQTVMPGDLPLSQAMAPVAVAKPSAAPWTPPPASSLQDMERDAVRAALERHQGRIADAARSLGVHRSTLYRWLQRPDQAEEGRPVRKPGQKSAS